MPTDDAREVLPRRSDSVSPTFPAEPESGAGATRIQLCGRLRVDIGDRHVTPRLRGRLGRALLAYLVLRRGSAISRDEMIDALWPVSTPAAPGAALRTQ